MTESEASSSLELLTFKLSDQEYSLDIMSVREIRGWTRTTPLPHAPKFMKGVINLRGTVLPVMDLAIRMGLEPRKQNERNVIIVVNHASTMTGLLVDAVSDIIALSSSDLQSPPDTQSDQSSGVVSALTLIEERMIRVLNLDAIANASESMTA